MKSFEDFTVSNRIPASEIHCAIGVFTPKELSNKAQGREQRERTLGQRIAEGANPNGIPPSAPRHRRKFEMTAIPNGSEQPKLFGLPGVTSSRFTYLFRVSTQGALALLATLGFVGKLLRSLKFATETG